METDVLLEARDIRIWFDTPQGRLRAVDGVDASIFRGKTLALVGESGCGKTTLARALIRLQPINSGSVRVLGQNLGPRTDRRWLSQHLQMVFQDPDASLNPRLTIGDAVTEPLVLHRKASGSLARKRAASLLERVGIDPSFVARYPHELSGGQKQRVCIARSLAVEPELLICDEAVSALDVSIQAQILNLLGELQDDLGVAYLFITHDLSVVRHIAHEVSVMYLGQIVEHAPATVLFSDPKHPYTKALLAAVPSVDQRMPESKQRVLGDVPSPVRPPPGCRFHTRCPERFAGCDQNVPPMYELGRRKVRCFLYA